MAVLAIVYVIVGFLVDVPGARSELVTIEALITVIFVAGRAGTARIAASRDRRRYLREHFIDLIALIPVARAFPSVFDCCGSFGRSTGLHRAFLEVDRLADHHGLGTLVIAWFGVVFLA